MAELTDPFTIGSIEVPNRVMLAPLAGIGNWFIRLQAKRYGAGMAVSEMVSSHAVHHGNDRTCNEMLRIDPREREGGPISIQLFGSDPKVMRSAAETVAGSGADMIDLNMGCPVPKVCKTGAGAALLADPDLAVEVARAAATGSGLPVTVKLRSGQRPGETTGVYLAQRLVADAGVAAITFHPRSAAVHHKGVPDYALASSLVESLEAPVIISGGLQDAEHVQRAFEQSGADAVMLARGSLGNPWLFEQVLGKRDREPTADEVFCELDWTIDRAAEHLGDERAARWLRKLYPWYIPRLGLEKTVAHALQGRLQAAFTLDEAKALLTIERESQQRPPGRRQPHAMLDGLAILLRSLQSAGEVLTLSARVCRASARVPLPAIEGPLPKDVILTPEGLEKLNDELELLSTERRREVAERIKEAREFGDISENSEYDDAKNEQAMLESRIAQLQDKLRMATVVETKDLSTDVVQIGSVVHIKDEKTGKSIKYTIVGSSESKPLENRLSNESPVGRALLGHKRNDTVAVKVPRGPARKLKITKIDVGLK